MDETVSVADAVNAAHDSPWRTVPVAGSSVSKVTVALRGWTSAVRTFEISGAVQSTVATSVVVTFVHHR